MLSGVVSLTDAIGRPLRSLRLSVTDRCNLRCRYCMPEKRYVWLPRDGILDFDEIDRLVGLFVSLGVERLRLTGGEPLLRRNLPALVASLRRHRGLTDLSLTTNGLLLGALAEALRDAGLDRVTVSLDTLRAERFRRITRVDGLPRVLGGIAAARDCGLRPLKIDAVIIRGVNDDELGELIDYGRSQDAEVRFIEYMPVAGATEWTPAQVVSSAEMLQAIEDRYGSARPLSNRGSSPAQRYRLPDGTTVGLIGSNSEPFCGACDRGRLTADGQWFQCLHAAAGVDLKTPLRSGASDEELGELLAQRWRARRDRGAAERTAGGSELPPRSADADQDCHAQMHTRGG